MEEIHSTLKEYVDDQVGSLRSAMNTRFDGIEGRFEGMRAEMGGLRSEIHGLSMKIDGLSLKIDGLAHMIQSMLSLYVPPSEDVRRLRHDVDVIQEVLSQREPRGFPHPPKS